MDNLLGGLKRISLLEDTVQNMSSGNLLDNTAKICDVGERTRANKRQVLCNIQFVMECFVGEQDKKLLVCMRDRKDSRQPRNLGKVEDTSKHREKSIICTLNTVISHKEVEHGDQS